ncbi:hypothetical protein [Luteimonas sp. A501]
MLPIVSGQADAAEVVRYDFQGAASVCQPATFAYAEGLDSRPLSFVNKGTTPVFVSCALRGDPRPGGRGAMKVLVEAGATGRRSGRVTCTFVEGYEQGDTSQAVYRTKSADVFTMSRGVALTWQPSEIAGAPEHIFRPALQCVLAPGTAIHYLSVTYDEDVGS